MRIALVIVALAGSASAAPVAIEVAPGLAAKLTVPAKWTEATEVAAQATSAVTQIGAGARRPVEGGARAWAAADGSAMLVVTWVAPSQAETPGEAVNAARAFVKDFSQRVRRGLLGLRVVVASTSTSLRGDGATATVEWHAKKHKLHGVSRAHVVALDKLGFRAVVVQCTYRDGSKAASSCTDAAGSLALSPGDGRLSLEAAAVPEAPAPPPTNDAAHDE